EDSPRSGKALEGEGAVLDGHGQSGPVEAQERVRGRQRDARVDLAPKDRPTGLDLHPAEVAARLGNRHVDDARLESLRDDEDLRRPRRDGRDLGTMEDGVAHDDALALPAPPPLAAGRPDLEGAFVDGAAPRGDQELDRDAGPNGDRALVVLGELDRVDVDRLRIRHAYAKGRRNRSIGRPNGTPLRIALERRDRKPRRVEDLDVEPGNRRRNRSIGRPNGPPLRIALARRDRTPGRVEELDVEPGNRRR